MNPDGPLSVRWRYLIKIIPWLYSYIKAGFSSELKQRGEAVYQLTGPSVELFEELAASVNCSELIVKTDYLQVYRTKAKLLKAESDMNARRELGFNISTVDAKRLRELEPDLSTDFNWGHHILGHGYIKDPQALVLAIQQQFCLEGGVYIEQAVTDIVQHQHSCEVVTGEQSISSDKLVIAAGAFSARILAATNIKIPLETERGYHITCPGAKVSLNRPVMEGDNKFLATPMQMGLRFAGTVELAGLDAPLNRRRIKSLQRGASKMMPGLNIDNSSEWLGFRPTLSDSLPVICSAPDNKRIIYAFGHQHLGLTCAPMTAAVVADLVAGGPPQIDIFRFFVKRLI
ncbi:MAG: hypothetical protein OFPI_30590 [Osedax symbiont Rs2]|nr:MAG: hypothetical protein OFPI_30590 [Osedax symbiont Rs2]